MLDCCVIELYRNILLIKYWADRMLEKIFQAIMRRYFGEFLTGIENVELAFWTGKINLNNIALKHEKINQLLKAKNIPFTIKYSHIGSLSIDIPWKSLSSTPVEVKVSDVYIVLKMEQFKSVSKKIEEEKLSLIKNYIEYLIKKSVENENSSTADSDEGYFKKMIVKIVHNLNAEVKNISIRIVCETQSTVMKEGDRQSVRLSGESFMSPKSGTDLLSGVERRVSETNSQFIRKNDKYFAFGFCIQQFSLSTVDENFNKKFYNLDNKKSPVRKIMTLKQISTYMQEQSNFNIFKVSQEKKNQFMKNVILRQKHRLLCIDGRILMNRNIEKDQFYDYLLTTNLQMLEVRSTYAQLKQLIKIFTNFSTASETKEIKKLCEVDEVLQQKMKPDFIQCFPKLHEKRFEVSSIDEKVSKILCSVSKKNMLQWTKDCAISIIKETKVQMVKKQKNKKGWLSYVISQAQVDLTQKQVNQIYDQVDDLIKNTDYEKKTSIRAELVLSKIVILLAHEQLEEKIKLELENTQLFYVRNATTNMHVSLTIENISLNYSNEKQNISTPLLVRGFCEMDENLLFLEYLQGTHQRKVSLQIAEIQLCHENHVLLLVNELIKLRTKEEMKSDIKLKKAELTQGKDIEEQLGKNYLIDIKVNRITFKIEVTQSSHILVFMDSIDVKTDEKISQHVGALKNLNINYVIASKKSSERDHVNSILKDFSLYFNISNYFNKINTKMEQLEINICEADLHNIYRGFLKQSQIFKAEKIEQKNKRIHESSYLKGHLKLLTIMKNWKDFEGVLTDDGLYFFEEELYDEEQNKTQHNQKFSHMIPLNNCFVTILNEEQFKIESDAVNELIECSSQQLHKWVDYIEKIVFENSSKLKMYRMIEKQEEIGSQIKNSKVKYETQVVFQFCKIQVYISQSRQKNLLKIGCERITVGMKESELQYERTVRVDDVVVKKLQGNIQTQMNNLLKNCRNEAAEPIQIRLRGKKKLHPEYRGEVQISVVVPYLKVNYDPQFLYKMIRKIAWGHQMPSYTNEMRNTKVLQLVKQFLQSTTYEKREEALRSKNCSQLSDYYKYSQIGRYRAEGHKCLVLLAVKIEVREVSINLINGNNNLCVFNLKGENLLVSLDKGSQFMFFKLTATNVELYDCTNYPHTNTKPFKISSLYPLLHRKSNPESKQAVQCCFSKFDLDSFINKSRIKSFFFLQIYDMQLSFQNQLINRFVDYLFNQIIAFILAPHSLHKYDGPRRGPYLYQYSQSMTEKQVRQVISDSLQPFFTKMLINAYNLTVKFNSFPQLEGFNIDFEDVKIETCNYEKGEKIRFNPSELSKIQKVPVYRQLLKMHGFQQKLLKSQWVSRMDITAEGATSIIFGSEIPRIETYVQRTLNSQKQTLFSFLSVDTSLICESYIKNLSIKAPKAIYNLINKCMMHNVSYDDQQDLHYTHNYQFKNFMKTSQIFYKLKADSLEIIVPEIKTVIAIPDFEYKFIRYPSMIKEMTVDGRSLNIFKNSEVIMMSSQYKDKNNKDINGLSYKIQMKLNGEKPMEVKLSYIDIQYNLPFFLEFVQYTILDQSCYPPLPPGTIINQLPDLPVINCKVHLQNSRIKLIVPNSENDDEFICSGGISLLWIRNALPHPEKYASNPQNFPQGKEWCSYRIELKNMQIRKHYQMKTFNQQPSVGLEPRTSYYNNQIISKGRYRSISNKISLVFRISQLMKLAPNQRDRYNDNIFDVKISQLWLKLSYVDIQHLKSVFAKQEPQPNDAPKEKQMNLMQESESQMPRIQPEPRQPAPVPVPVPPTYTAYTKYSIDISLIHLQLGLSQLPVPLLDFMVKSAKSNIDIIGTNINGELKSTIMANCWNMLIGRWQPIIEDLTLALSFRLGKDKYLLLDCSKIVLLNVSLESLKILKLLSSDFNQKGKFSISQIWTGDQESKTDNKIKGINVSPYVLTNRTGITFQVLSQISENKTKLKPQEKTYIDLKNYDMDFSEKLKVYIEFEGNFNKIQIDMDLATCKKIPLQFKQRNYELLLRPISNSIMKQIIVSSLFVIENRTSYGMSFYYNCGLDEEEKDTYEGRIKVMPKQKTALKFTANIKNINTKGPQKHLKLDFPELQKFEIENNFEFPYEAILHDYEHRIDLNRDKSFNCVVGRREELETTIVVEPSFYIKNLLPIDVRVEFVVEKTGKADKGEICSYELGVNQEKDVYDFNSKEKIQVRLKMKGFNISSFQSITTIVNNQQEYKTCLDLIDYRGHTGKIAIKIVKQNKVRKMYIFSEAVLINQTSYDWYVFSSSKLMPGQKLPEVAEQQTPYTFIHASEYQSLNFGFSDDTPFTSGEIKMSQLGIHNMSMYRNEQLYEFTIKCTFHCLDNDALIYSYVLKAQPRYIFVNQTTCVVEIKQHNTEDKSQLIKVAERFNWIWPVRTEQKLIQLRLLNNQVELGDSQWMYSSPLAITSTDIEEIVIALRPKDNSVDKKLVKIIPIKQNQSNFFLIEEVIKPEDFLVTINNELEHCKLRAYQSCIDNQNPSWIEQKQFEIKPKNSIPFGWDYPHSEHMITIEISFVGYLRTKFDPHNITISLDTQKVEQVLITNDDGQTQAITIKIEIIGLRKKITFCKKQGFEEQDSELQMMHTGNRFAFSFTEIGISIISSVKKRSQLLFLNLKKLQIIMMEKKSSRSLQVKVKYINIDNNYNHNTIYPILLTPLKHQKTLKKSRPFFVLLLQQTLDSKDIIQIKQLRICNEPVSIKIHDEVLTAVLEMVQQINKQTDKTQGRIDLVPIFRTRFQHMEWQQFKLMKPQRDIFFREFEIAKVELELTFSIRPKLNTNNFIIMTILSSFGAAISNVSEAQLTLSRFLKKDKGLSELKAELSDFYLMQFMKGIYKVLGSINLFGNPYVFLRLVAEGAWEIVNQPTQGFIKGPVEGAIGIVKGGVFFTRNIVAGTCNSFEAISQSISRGVSYMTMDPKFIERRQKIKIQKSNHFFKGLQYGAFSIYTGVEVAITGLVRHPVEGYAANGFLGGLTGTLKGFSGLLTKPISGTFEGISKISQGIKNTALMFQDGPNSKRVRPPRIFYSDLAYYKNYNIFESTAISILQFCSTKYLNQQINYISLVHNEQLKEVHAYVLTQKFCSHVDVLGNKLIEEVEIASIQELKIQEDALHIMTHRNVIVVDRENYNDLFEALQKYYFYDF